MELGACGHIVGNGAAINISLGWYPDRVDVINMTDGDIMTIGSLARMSVAFTSGGTTEIVAGNLITGATSGSTAYVRAVLLSSGTWAGGDAAGFFIISSQTGTFASENVYVPGGTNDATITAAATPCVKIDTAVATVTGNSAISRYEGSTTAAHGFTIGSTVAEEAKLLQWFAWRAQEKVYGQ